MTTAPSGKAEAQQFMVQMPLGYEPGQLVQVTSPDGQLMQFPAPDVAPGSEFPVAYVPRKNGLAPTTQPSAPPIDVSDMVQLHDVLNRFEITLAQAVDLNVLRDYEIVVIADDSGSMSIRDPGSRMTRWEELKDTLNLIVEVGSCFDASGIDIYFLNRPKVTEVTSKTHAGFQKSLLDPPRGGTPLTEKLHEVVEECGGAKPVLLMILTDGVPNGGPGLFTASIKNLVMKRSTPYTFRVQIMACTGDDDAVGWINVLDAQFKEVDATDDYYTERREILRSGRMRNFTHGDWVMKAMLGAILDKYDEMNNEAGNCVGRCSNSCSIM